MNATTPDRRTLAERIADAGPACSYRGPNWACHAKATAVLFVRRPVIAARAGSAEVPASGSAYHRCDLHTADAIRGMGPTHLRAMPIGSVSQALTFARAWLLRILGRWAG